MIGRSADGGRPGRGALVGATFSSAFGGLWALWASNGLVGAVAVTVAAVGVLVAVGLVLAAMLLARRAGPDVRPSLFVERRYWTVVVAEAVAIVGGNLVLGATGHPAYASAWTALVVGVHFVAFGRLFTTRFTPIGWALVGAAIVGTAVGLAVGPGGVVVVTGLVAAVVLLGAGAVVVVGAARSRSE